MEPPAGASAEAADPALSPGARFARALPYCGLAVLALWLYRDFGAWLRWNWTTGSVESHCAVVPLMALGLCWMRRDELARTPDEPCPLGLVLAVWACVLGL